MGTVMIRCPKTGRAISTGIRADVATFHATPVFFSQVLCPQISIVAVEPPLGAS